MDWVARDFESIKDGFSNSYMFRELYCSIRIIILAFEKIVSKSNSYFGTASGKPIHHGKVVLH